MDVFEKVDLAIKALQNAEEKTVFAPPASSADISRFNDLLAAAKLPQLPLDFMYLLSKFGACDGPYFKINLLDGLHGAREPQDVPAIEYAIALNSGEEDEAERALPLGDIPGLHLYGLTYQLFFKGGNYYHVENERGHTLHYFIGPDNIGDFIIKEIKNAEAGRQKIAVEKLSE